MSNSPPQIEWLFPTAFWHVKNNGSHPDEVLSWALSFYEDDSKRRSNRNGFQTESSWDYGDLIHKEYVIDQLNFLPKFQFQNWWININPKGGYHVAHTHPGSDLSVVWYLTDNHSGPIRFLSPFSHTRDQLDKSMGLESDHPRLAEKGDLLVFPSDLVHYVEPNQSDEVRVSISFNLQLM